jgi:hypothetical protein
VGEARHCGAFVTFRGNSGRDVLAAMVVGNEERRQPGLADASKAISRGNISRGVSKVNRKLSQRSSQSGSCRTCVTSRAPKTTVHATQSMTKNPGSPRGVCLGHGKVVDPSESTLVFASLSAFRTVSRFTDTPRSTRDMVSEKTGECTPRPGGSHRSVSARATGGRSWQARIETRLHTARLRSCEAGRVEDQPISFE